MIETNIEALKNIDRLHLYQEISVIINHFS